MGGGRGVWEQPALMWVWVCVCVGGGNVCDRVCLASSIPHPNKRGWPCTTQKNTKSVEVRCLSWAAERTRQNLLRCRSHIKAFWVSISSTWITPGPSDWRPVSKSILAESEVTGWNMCSIKTEKVGFHKFKSYGWGGNCISSDITTSWR